jgi:hypothetical protein
MDNFYLIGEYKISKICLQSNPCQHKVLNTITNLRCTMSKPNICKILSEKKLSHPHFNCHFKALNNKVVDLEATITAFEK